MNIKSFLAASVIAAATLGAAGASADTGFYVGGSVGSSYIKAQDGGFKLDGDDVGYKVFGGFQLFSLLAIEAGYVDFGEISDNSHGVRGDVAVDAWDAFLVGNLPLGPLNFFAKGGVVAYNADLKAAFDQVDTRFKDSSSDEDLAFGLGASVELGSFAVRAEYEYFDASDFDDLSMYSVGLTYQF